MDVLSYRSATTWLIVACVVIFVLDHVVLPGKWMGTTERITLNNSDVDRSLDSIDTSGNPLKGVELTVHTADGSEQDRVLDYAWPIRNPQGRADQVFGYEVVVPMRYLESHLHFSTDRGFLRLEFWRLVGYQFLHSHTLLVHIVLNMIGLFFFGPMVEEYLGRKRFVAFYLLCGIFGALMYVTLNLGGMIAESMYGDAVRVPGLIFSEQSQPLIGASGSVFGVLMAASFLDPKTRVLLFFIVPMRLLTLAYLLVGVAMFSIITGQENAGGEAAHLGGAMAGYYFIRHPHHLHDFFDVLGRVDPTSHHYRGANALPGESESTPPGGDAST